MNGKFVCVDCFEDGAIKTFVEKYVEAEECSYCGRISERGENIAASMDRVIEFMAQKLAIEFQDPVDGVSWNSAEGGWLGVEVYDTGELFIDCLGGFPCSNNDLIEDILDGIGEQQWCARDPYELSPGQGLSFGWTEFCRLVKHETRFMFFPPHDETEDYEPEAVAPGEILSKIGELIQSAAMVKKIPAGTCIYRARAHASAVTLTTVEELAAPPNHKSPTNRMNPAGIPMFYGAYEKDTAVEEVKSPEWQAVSIGRFEVIHDVLVVDLTKLRPIPGVFDEGR